MITIDVLPINPWQENTYILSDETKECVIIDPGCLSADERKFISDFIANKDLKPVRLLHTHASGSCVWIGLHSQNLRFAV